MPQLPSFGDFIATNESGPPTPDMAANIAIVEKKLRNINLIAFNRVWDFYAIGLIDFLVPTV